MWILWSILHLTWITNHLVIALLFIIHMFANKANLKRHLYQRLNALLLCFSSLLHIFVHQCERFQAADTRSWMWLSFIRQSLVSSHFFENPLAKTWNCIIHHSQALILNYCREKLCVVGVWWCIWKAFPESNCFTLTKMKAWWMMYLQSLRGICKLVFILCLHRWLRSQECGLNANMGVWWKFCLEEKELNIVL